MEKNESGIKVCVRARPLFERETKEVFKYTNQLISTTKGKPLSFTFDKVYWGSSATEKIYTEMGAHIVEHVIEGYNGTIFAYGQTTSGKTHTMIGSESLPGITPLALNDLFRHINKSDKDFKVWVSYLEIYNEVINDLLNSASINLRIREDPSQGSFVSGLRHKRVTGVEEVIETLRSGESNRKYRATNIHEHSSRSHTVFRVLVESEEIQDLGEEVHMKGNVRLSVLNLVDLAGSERANDVGDNSETNYINKSLFVLANVINKLAEGGTHIPYRDSKLTRILANSLGGNAFTSIICNISPDVSNLSLSLSTLRFAFRAKKIKNKPQVNEVVDDSNLIYTLRQRISALEGQVASIRSSKDEEIQKLKQENQKLKEQLEDKRFQEPQTFKLINVSETEFQETYKNLQANYRIQIQTKYDLMEEIEVLKERGFIGFDIQKAEFEKENYSAKSLRTWEEECLKLRNNYLIELAALDSSYYSRLSQLHSRLSPSHSQKSSQEKKREVVTRKQVRPTTQVKNFRKPPQNSSNSTSASGKSPSPSLFKSKPLAKKGPALKAKPLETDSENEESPEENSGYNPAPFESMPSDSSNAQEISLEKGGNVLLFGMNHEGSCGRQVYLSKPDFNLVDYEFEKVVCGHSHTGLVDKKGVVFMLGKGQVGQLGSGKLESTHIPTPITHPLHGVAVIQLACGWQHCLCVVETGEVYSWGYNRDGQLGLGDFYDRSWPVKVPGLDIIKRVSAGHVHSGCISIEKKLYMWGANPDGRLFKAPNQLKHQIYKKEKVPSLVEEFQLVKDVQLGTSHSILLTEEGEVLAAGSTEHGQLGIGPNYMVFCKGSKLSVFKKNVWKIAAGDKFSGVLCRNGDLYTFGKGADGRLGTGNTLDQLSPKKVGRKFTDIACGGRHMLALDEEGELWTWGQGFNYQLGNFCQEDVLKPTIIDLSGHTGKWAKSISCGYFHSAVLTL